MDSRVTSRLDPSGLPDDEHTLPPITELSFPALGVRSLCWDGDELVDWVGGGQRWTLDGRALPPVREPETTFDGAVVLPGSPWAAVFEKRGEAGLILRDGRPWRSLKRAEHCAGSYHYPIVLFRLAGGRAVIAHCPESYCSLHIDDLETGETIAACPIPDADDYFPAGLEVSPCGRWLLSAGGWVWHPLSNVRVYDIEAALRDPRTLGGEGIPISVWADCADASFLPDSRLLVTLTGNWADLDDGTHFDDELALYDLARPDSPRRWPLDSWTCGVVAMGAAHAFTFHQHLRLVALDGLREVRDWPDFTLSAGERAFDSQRGRLAWAQDDRIVVLQLKAP